MKSQHEIKDAARSEKKNEAADLFCQNDIVASQSADSVVVVVPTPAWQGQGILLMRG